MFDTAPAAEMYSDYLVPLFTSFYSAPNGKKSHFAKFSYLNRGPLPRVAFQKNKNDAGCQIQAVKMCALDPILLLYICGTTKTTDS